MTPGWARPTAPDAALLAEAAANLAAINGLDSAKIELTVGGARIDRRRSVVFPLHATGTAGIAAYYKAMEQPETGMSESAVVRLARTRDGLARTMDLEQRLAALLEGRPVTFARTLAVDPQRLVTVTQTVEGHPFGATWPHVIAPGRLEDARTTMGLVGEAARAVEACTVDELAADDEDSGPRTTSRLKRLGAVVGPDRASEIGDLLGHLQAEALSQPSAVVYSHGDLSSTNILVGETVGLIDFAWTPRVRGYDVAKLAFRLEYGDALPSFLSRGITEALVEGYGDGGADASATWKYHRLWMLSKVVADRRSGQPIRRNRASAEIDEMLAAA